MDNNEPKKSPFQLGKKLSPSIFIWLILIAVFVILIVMKTSNSGETVNLTDTQFLQSLKDGAVKSVVVRQSEGGIAPISGKIYVQQSATTSGGQTIDSKYILKNFTSKICSNDSILNEIRKSKVKFSVEGKNIIALTDKKSFSNVNMSAKPDSGLGAMLTTIIPFVIILGLLLFFFSRQVKMAGKGAMQFGKSRARMIMPEDLKTTFDDIAGADEAKEDVKEIIDFLKDPLKFQLVGGKIPKGALLMGPPGTGKTLLAKAVACEANVPFFSISGSDFMEMFVGVGASRVRDMFEQARKNSPCLIFIDEIDAVGRTRFSGGVGGGHDEREQTLNAMLVEMDGLETQSGVIVLAATNRPDVLDPALLRPGRFDRQIVLDLPDIRGRKKILQVHAATIRLDDNVNLDLIARGTPGFSGADLANLVNEAALAAARDNRECANMADFENSRDKVCWGKERRSRKISERERKLTAFHEAGHALVALHREFADPLHKVTIIPRGRALGVTLTLPDEEVYTRSRLQFLDQMAVMMGGRAAEKIVFDDITSGASSDIEQASKIARAMVCSYGMVDEIGPVKYRPHGDNPYLGNPEDSSAICSDETTREIDVEVKSLLQQANQDAIDLLTKYRDQLDKLSNELLEKETLEVKDVKELLGMPYEEIDVNFRIDDDDEEEDKKKKTENAMKSMVDDIVVENFDSTKESSAENSEEA